MSTLQAELLVTGVVQGVGFRPFCARMARLLELTGTVRNSSHGVEILIEGPEKDVDEYIRILHEEHPAAAVVSDIKVRRRPLGHRSFTDFSIAESVKSEDQRVLIPADLAVCEECLAEMNDPQNRRYRYPFINCTNCGPRYTIIAGLPYDRPQTTMKSFPMCPDCLREYHDPADRRYHAQPNACPVCGPGVRLCSLEGKTLCEGEEAIASLTAGLEEGRLAAIKGIGGFHIACLPQDIPLEELRRRKKRPDKPFALMVRDIEAARRVVHLTPEAERLLAGVQRPIVLCPANTSAPLSRLTAPGQKRLGIMLPYAPLHHLLMERFDALVMTSANISEAPIVSSDGDAFRSLKDIADVFLCHNRDIHTAIDDSVIIPAESGPQTTPAIFLRRARGYVPNPMALPFESPDILAAGAQMKATYALTRGNVLFPGQYLGDMDQLETAAYYKNSLTHFLRLYGIEPRILAVDKHPGYAAASLAKSLIDGSPGLHPVQHHHAHLASVLLDNRHFDPVIGVLFDGTGYGDDGTLWGGEFLAGNAESFRRLGSLRPSRLPGGENAIRDPWRYALSLLAETLGGAEAEKIAESLWPRFRPLIPPVMAAAGAASVTTSCGRLFDGFSALLNLCPAASYDGQAAMALENAAAGDLSLPFRIQDEDDFLLLDWRDAVKSLVLSPASAPELAGAFHRGLAEALADICVLLREKTGLENVALSGGVWQNRLLRNLACTELRRRGFMVLTHRHISPNDEGISVGQALVAAQSHHDTKGRVNGHE